MISKLNEEYYKKGKYTKESFEQRKSELNAQLLEVRNKLK